MGKIMKYELLIFDLDNTIFDYNKAENFALEKTLKYLGCPAGEEIKESYRVINEETWQRYESGEITSLQLRTQRFERFGEHHGFNWDAAEVSKLYLENLGRGGFLLDGVEPLLRSLSADFPLAALTNGIADVQHARLANSTLKDLFYPVIISDEVGVAKPDPAIFEILLEKADIKDRESVLMIGDSLTSDIAGSIAAGIACCWYNPNGSVLPTDVKPDFIVKSLSDVKDIVYGE